MTKPVLLVAEDNAMDALLLERVLERCGGVFRFAHVDNGEALIEYLTGKNGFDDRERFPPPDLILLDLKMPRKDGFAVLRWRQETPAFIQIPVIVFSSSSLPEDVSRAYALGANSYAVKPSDPTRFEALVAALQNWWAVFNVGSSRR